MNHTVAKREEKKNNFEEGERQKFTTESREITCAAQLHAHNFPSIICEMMYMCVKAQLLELFGRRKNIDFFPL